MAILTASQLRLHYGEMEVFSGVDLEVGERARIGLVGPNGSGKTSLLRVLVGDLEPDGGSVTGVGQLRTGYVAQTQERVGGSSLREVVMSAFDELRHLEDALAASALELQWADPSQRRQAERRYSSLVQRYEALGGYDYLAHMERVVAGVGLPSAALETPADQASGGERTRAALAKALLVDPSLLVLDEPTNYLDIKGLDWFETFLSRFSHAFIVVSHDRYFLDRVVSEIWELDRGRLKAFQGNYAKYRALKAEQALRQEREFERQQEYIAKEQSFIQRYHAGQRAREARGRAKRLERLKRVDAPESEGGIRIGAVAASRTGQLVLGTRGLKVGFVEGDRRVQLLSVPDMELERGTRTAIIGSNGSGKTTLLQTMLGHAEPLSGMVRLGHKVEVGYHYQGSSDLPKDSTVLDALLDARNVPLEQARTYLARFLLQSDDVFRLVASLSGGERNRLALARLLLTDPNFLVLDEPTTHLDILSREALEQALLAYGGTLLFVSHDRHLISLLAERLWLVEDGAVRPFAGTLAEWMESTCPDEAPRPAARRRTRPRKRAPAIKKEPPRPQEPDPEQVVQELESRLAEIERGLEAASERRDVAEVARLGKEHDEVRARLVCAWERWSG